METIEFTVWLFDHWTISVGLSFLAALIIIKIVIAVMKATPFI